MARKVFLSVLGSGYYHEAVYFHANDPANNHGIHRFVQEANLLEYASEWTKNDHAYFFVTTGDNGSIDKNWGAEAQIDHNEGAYQGLSKRLEKLKLPFNCESVEIPEGFSEKEIWDIFEIVFEKLKEGDEIYFDITHAFRSIPTLVMVLINYAKFLKNIEVKQILYGAFEKLGPAYKVKLISPEKRLVPVLDLTSFSHLQDWTAAANDFVNNGRVEKLVGLANNEISPILKETSGKDEASANIREIIKNLPQFILNIQTCRGFKIRQNVEGFQLNQLIDISRGSVIKPLVHILEKIKHQVMPFTVKENSKNGFLAVKWCLDNGLIQQGITLLRETITTLICEECNLDYKIEKNRNIVDSCFTIITKELPENEWKGDAGNSPEVTKKVILTSKLLILLKKEFSSLSEIRNDINHAGFKNNSITKPVKFESNLSKLLCDIQTKVL